jgi:glyoxylase-like metal-dependent hydrolase (beta-lactamase superfamily II)
MALTVDRYELGAAATNCYLVRPDPHAEEAVVVDPGADAPSLLRELEARAAVCAAILITHAHWDHLLAVADLAEATAARVYMPALEAVVLARPQGVFPGIDIRPHEAEVLLEGGEQLELAGISFETVRVPGHSPGHVAYYADGALFSGDVLFAGSVGRTDVPYSDWDTLVESIRSLMDRFSPDTIVYSGHGPETTLGAELARNPFLAELRAS